MDDPSVSDHRAFTQLLDKGFTVRVVKAEWCPTMDLIAILAQEGQLHVYRLNWQRLWTSTTEFPITAVCWRPDGRQLAVGLEDGQVLLLNTENGEVMGQYQVYEQTSVSAINWTYKQTEDESPTHSSYFDDRRVEVFFEPPVSEKDLNGAGGRVHQSSTSTASGLKGFSERFTPNLSNGNAAWPSRSTSLSVLACVSNKGEIALLSDGLFPLMKTTSVFVGLDHLEIDILGLETAPDLQSLSILWTDQGAYNLCLDQLNISTVGGNAELMRNLAMLGADIVGSMHRCAELCNTLRTHWSSAANAMQEFKNSLVSLNVIKLSYIK